MLRFPSHMKAFSPNDIYVRFKKLYTMNCDKLQVFLIGKARFEDVDKSGYRGAFECIEEGHEHSLIDEVVTEVFLPVKCRNCDAVNILTGDLREVEAEDREMGKYAIHEAELYGTCHKCNVKLKAVVSIAEYPPGAFYNPEIEETENCDYLCVGGLKDFAKTVFEIGGYEEIK